MSLRKIGLDTRELEHPAPLEMAMQILHTLDDTNYLYMRHRKKPLPLLDLAKEHDFQILTKKDTKDEWHILICKNKTIKLNDLLDV